MTLAMSETALPATRMLGFLCLENGACMFKQRVLSIGGSSPSVAAHTIKSQSFSLMIVGDPLVASFISTT